MRPAFQQNVIFKHNLTKVDMQISKFKTLNAGLYFYDQPRHREHKLKPEGGQR
jgi:hypothetical protein